MKKDYKVEITETLSKSFYVNAESLEEAEDIIREKYNNCEIVLTADDYDNDVEFEVEEADPRNTSYLMSKGWSSINAYYISEMFSTLNRLKINDYDNEVADIVNCSEDSELVGKYDEKYFDSHIADICGYKFYDIQPGEFEQEYKFYKTIDGKFIMEFQI